MNGAAPVFLVDTNVWLDNYLGFRPNHRASCEFLDEAVERGATLCHAATTAKDDPFLHLQHPQESGAREGRSGRRSLRAGREPPSLGEPR